MPNIAPCCLTAGLWAGKLRPCTLPPIQENQPHSRRTPDNITVTVQAVNETHQGADRHWQQEIGLAGDDDCRRRTEDRLRRCGRGQPELQQRRVEQRSGYQSRRPRRDRSAATNTTIPLVTGSPNNLGYQFGSTFKMFTMLAALESGLPLSYKINTTFQYKSNFLDPGDPNACGGFYCPTNSSKNEKARTTCGRATATPVNTYFVPLEDRIGTAGPIDVARRLASRSPRRLHINPATFGAFTLGVIPVTPLQMASAYGAVANDGMYCKPLPVKSITDSSGHQLDIAKPQCTQAIQPDIARLALDAARCPVGNQSQLHGLHRVARRPTCLTRSTADRSPARPARPTTTRHTRSLR